MTNIQQGQPLPQVGVDNKGEAIVVGGNLSYQPWNSAGLEGKVRCVLHMAGRSSAKEVNEALIDALKQAGFPEDEYQTTTIVNLKDAIFGTGAVVTMMVESGKKEFPWSSVVVDAKGVVREKWGLTKESSAAIVLNRQGNVLFAKDGQLSSAEVSQVIGLVSSELAEANAPA